MSDRIIHQPDGRFAIFSTITDTITAWGLTREGVIGWYVARATAEARASAERALDALNRALVARAYLADDITWQEALGHDRQNGGGAWRAFANPSTTPDPNGCFYCGIDERAHRSQWLPDVGYHEWVTPTQEQRKARMLARRARDTAARRPTPERTP